MDALQKSDYLQQKIQNRVCIEEFMKKLVVDKHLPFKNGFKWLKIVKYGKKIERKQELKMVTNSKKQ